MANVRFKTRGPDRKSQGPREPRQERLTPTQRAGLERARVLIGRSTAASRDLLREHPSEKLRQFIEGEMEANAAALAVLDEMLGGERG